jgi:uncharacterized membrane protein YkvA (DUF1232 family)
MSSKPEWIVFLQRQADKLKDQVVTLYFAYQNPRTPWYAKLFSSLVVAYALSPIDLIPDFIPILGYVDDLIIIPGGVWLAIRMIPPDILAEAKNQAAASAEGKRVNWWAAGLIILIWVVILLVIGRWIWGIWKKANP